MKKDKANTAGKLYIDRSDDLPERANPVRWDAPSNRMPNHEFFRIRWVHCLFYSRCMNYASGLHWEGWSCCWCVYNPYGERFDETDADKSTKILWKINRARTKKGRTTEDI